METLMQSLSWTLIYSLGQGLLIYALLVASFKIVPDMSASVKYLLSTSALAILFVLFWATFWFHYQYGNLQATGGSFSVLSLYSGSDWSAGAFPADKRFGMVSDWVHRAGAWFTLFYCAGVAFMIGRLFWAIRETRMLTQEGTMPPDRQMLDTVDNLKKRIGYSGIVRICVSVRAQVPLVTGFLKPVILIPAATLAQLSVLQLEAVLLHELAHIKRYDFVVNIMQTAVEVFMFFNVFVWLISSICRSEREHCCDDIVVAHTQDPLSYAYALANLATLASSTPYFAMAAAGSRNQLFHRIKRFTEMKTDKMNSNRALAAILVVAVLGISVVCYLPTAVGAFKNKIKAGTAVVEKVDAVVQDAAEQETSKLVKRLMDDKLVVESEGFLIEKRQNTLFVNGKQLPGDIATKYLNPQQQENIRVHVLSFTERMMQHPDANLIQIAAPVLMNSDCIEKSNKPGC